MFVLTWEVFWWTAPKVCPEDVKRGLRADSLGTVIGAIFNTFPYVSYSQNIGLVGVTGVYSRWVCVAGGIILLILGLIPKLAYIVASIPQCVLGGAGFIMFGMVAATGIKILATVDYAKQRNSVLVVAISIGFGLIPIVSPNFFRIFPEVLKPIFGDGIILTSISAILLNAFFNPTTREQAEADTFLAAQAAEHIWASWCLQRHRRCHLCGGYLATVAMGLSSPPGVRQIRGRANSGVAHRGGESFGLWGAALRAWEMPGEIATAGRIAFIYHADYLGGALFMALPSGRLLTYPQPRWRCRHPWPGW
jgi:hypothetical protein